MNRENKQNVQLSPEEWEMITSRIDTVTTLTDWAILNDRVWDKRLTAFYKSLYGKKEEGN